MDALDFRSFVKSLHGRSFVTPYRGFEFEVNVCPSGLQYTPTSTGRSWFHAWKDIDKAVARFVKTRSLQLDDYQDITANAFYVLTLICQYNQVKQTADQSGGHEN